MHLGLVKSWFLTDFWQIQRIYAIVMSEAVGMDIQEIELRHQSKHRWLLSKYLICMQSWKIYFMCIMVI